jgi:HEAT repeat protein
MPENVYEKMGLAELLQAALHHVDLQARSEIQRRGSAAVPDLVRLLEDRKGEARWWIASTLGDLGDPAAVPPLIAALDDEAEVARWAAHALGQLKDVRAVDPLIRVLRHDEKGVREYAATALGRLGDPRAVGPLSETLTQDASWYVRCQTAQALGMLKDAAAVPALVGAVERDAEEWEFVASGAASALEQIDAPTPLQGLIPALGRPMNDFHRESIVGAVTKLARHDRSPLLQGLSSPDPLIREGCALGLREAGSEDVAAPMLALLNDPVKLVRQAARATLKAWRRKGLRVDVPSRRPGEAVGDVLRWLLEYYFVVPATGGFSAYRTGWMMHLMFSVLVCAAGGLIARRVFDASLPVVAAAAFAPVFLLWGAGVWAGVLSHYNPLITLGGVAVMAGAAVLIGQKFPAVAMAGVAGHAVAYVLVRIMSFLSSLILRHSRSTLPRAIS